MAAAILLLAPGCRGHTARVLVDGSPPPPVPSSLASIDDALLARTRAVRAERLPRVDRAACTELRGYPGSTAVVETVGVAGRSVTFRSRTEPDLLACDGTPGVHEFPGPWCGGAAGRLVRGKLRDPRLDVLCQHQQAGNVAFVWIEPLAEARWVGVDQGSYTEVYEVVAGFPVRVSSTRSVRLEKSRATFDVMQYAADGTILQKTRLEAAVAG